MKCFAAFCLYQVCSSKRISEKKLTLYVGDGFVDFEYWILDGGNRKGCPYRLERRDTQIGRLYDVWDGWQA